MAPVIGAGVAPAFVGGGSNGQVEPEPLVFCMSKRGIATGHPPKHDEGCDHPYSGNCSGKSDKCSHIGDGIGGDGGEGCANSGHVG